MTFQQWLQASYDYYYKSGSDVADIFWDQYAKTFSKEVEELSGKEYTGGSLFWLSKDDYPTWIMR